jgi:hypothetical protein
MLHFLPFLSLHISSHRTCAFCEGFILSSCASKRAHCGSLSFFTLTQTSQPSLLMWSGSRPLRHIICMWCSPAARIRSLSFSHMCMPSPHDAAGSYVLNRVCLFFCCSAAMGPSVAVKLMIVLPALLATLGVASVQGKSSEFHSRAHTSLWLCYATGQSHLVQIRRGSVNRR